MFEIAIMLLPVAAASGWYVASKHYHSKEKSSSSEHDGYFKGLNFLLNEQPDKAISVFIDLLEVDDETIEVHLALGTLFRQRGEVEKAIRLHQNLIARPQINQQARSNALNELGLDYMRAGLLDRAENIFLELEKDTVFRVHAVKQLLSIFQQEKEWQQAIDYTFKLEMMGAGKQPVLLSQLHCELALLHKKQGDDVAVRNDLKKALRIDSSCVRANVISAELAVEKSDYKHALKLIMAISKQDKRFIPVYLNLILTCFDQIGKPKAKFNFLADLQAGNDSTIVMSRFIDVLVEQKSSKEAATFLHKRLLENPNQGYLRLYAKIGDENGDTESSFLRNIIQNFEEKPISFECKNCGFSSVELNWYCPSCKQWGTTKPVVV
ncbi:MAG: N-acetylglucosaminyl transferase [Cycloclasticus sp. symbiont of Poecilosclerida sp. N]|nr:MAG: N-acetylglucosaminyl transferase [Cycloclasticus sp. symbiont of Poecilosclerida sp. N]